MRQSVVPLRKPAEVLSDNEPLYWDMRHFCKQEVKNVLPKMGSGPFLAHCISAGVSKEEQVAHIVPPLGGTQETVEVAGLYLTHRTYDDQGARP